MYPRCLLHIAVCVLLLHMQINAHARDAETGIFAACGSVQRQDYLKKMLAKAGRVFWMLPVLVTSSS